MQAALARGGGEHPTLVAVYVEEGSLHAAGVQSRIDRHHEVLLLGCLETRPNRTQDANAQPPLTTVLLPPPIVEYHTSHSYASSLVAPNLFACRS